MAVCLVWAWGAAAQTPLVVVGHPEADSDARAPSAAAQILAVDEAAGAADLGDLLDAASGVEVRRTGGEGRAQAVQLRGAGAHQVAVFLDGVPLQGGRGGGLDLAAVPLAWLDEVTVVRGAAAAIDGSGAQGGVLRLRLRRAGFGDQGRARLRLGAGELVGVDGGWAHGDADAGLVVLATAQQAEGDFPYRDARGDLRTRRNAAHRQGGLLLHGRLRAGGGELSALLEGFANARGEPGPEQFEDLDAESAAQRGQAAARWVAELDDGRWAVEALAFGRVQGWQFDDPSPADATAATAVRQVDQLQGARAQGSWRPEGHALTVALDGRRDAATTRAEDAPDRDEARLAGALTAVEAWTPHAKVTLIGALRLDAAQGRDPLPVPAAGVVFRPHRKLTLRANVGRAFRDPSFDELYFVGPGVRGDPDLRPEDGWAVDGAIQLHPNRRLLIELAAFHQRYDRLILFVPINAFQVRATDDRGATLTGVEARVELRLNRLTAVAGYDHLRHAFAHAPHAPLPYRPRHAGFGALALHLRRATLHTTVRARGEVHSDVFGQRTLPAYTTWDVGAEGDLGHGFAAGLTARNVLDARALDAVQQPLPGRTLLFELRWSTGGL
ncbi:MAG: TonB-dependent receptor [Myxococcales bacterium]|nr:TonB-dependent receptor [Myxococcales bacterium]